MIADSFFVRRGGNFQHRDTAHSGVMFFSPKDRLPWLPWMPRRFQFLEDMSIHIHADDHGKSFAIFVGKKLDWFCHSAAFGKVYCKQM
jgi:hypothetical protein